jgi:predicted aspartyl protease
MLMDTGADVTVLPLAALKQLGVAVEMQTDYQLVAFDGTRSAAPWALVHVVLLSFVFRGRYVVIDQEVGVIGRDILNLLTIVLDGPGQTWYRQQADGPGA